MIAVCIYSSSALSLAHASDLRRSAVPIILKLCMAGDGACVEWGERKVRHQAALPHNAPSFRAGLMKLCLRMAGDGSCATRAVSGTPQEAAVEPGEPGYKTGILNETLSLYKTISYVTGATLTDQIWYLTIASEAVATGGIFFVVNAATSSMMTYNYEYFWNICCRAPPGPDGIVPVSATKAIIYRALSVIRVGALALIFGNTIPSAAIVTLAITFSRTAVYVTNDYVWNRIDVMKPINPDPAGATNVVPSMLRASFQPASVGQIRMTDRSFGVADPHISELIIRLPTGKYARTNRATDK